MNNNFIILLTGCIEPNGMKYTSLQDSRIREEQYFNAINFYLQETTLNIVFCENSNKISFAKHFKSYQDTGRYEYITFDGNSFDKNKGKGYGEALIIKYALNNAKLINKESILIKITGRLIFKNINSLINEISLKKNYYTVASNCSARNNQMCNSFLIIAPVRFYNNFFLKDLNLINDTENIFFEHILYQNIIKWINEGNIYHEFYHFINTTGISGSTGLPYPRTTFKRRLKSLIKGIYINIIRQGKYIFKMKQIKKFPSQESNNSFII